MLNRSLNKYNTFGSNCPYSNFQLLQYTIKHPQFSSQFTVLHVKQAYCAGTMKTRDHFSYAFYVSNTSKHVFFPPSIKKSNLRACSNLFMTGPQTINGREKYINHKKAESASNIATALFKVVCKVTIVSILYQRNKLFLPIALIQRKQLYSSETPTSFYKAREIN